MTEVLLPLMILTSIGVRTTATATATVTTTTVTITVLETYRVTLVAIE